MNHVANNLKYTNKMTLTSTASEVSYIIIDSVANQIGNQIYSLNHQSKDSTHPGI